MYNDLKTPKERLAKKFKVTGILAKRKNIMAKAIESKMGDKDNKK